MPALFLDPQVESVIHLNVQSGLSEEQCSFLEAPVSPGLLNLLIAVAGSGKSTTIASKVVTLMINPAIANILCLTSTKSAASSLVTKINEAVARCGLGETGHAFPSSNVRTFHSVALRGNRRRNDSFEIITDVKSMLLEVLDDFLDPYYLKASGARCWASFWTHAKQDPAMLVYTDTVDEEKLGTAQAGKECFKLTLDNDATKNILNAAGFVECTIDILVARLIAARKEMLSRLTPLEDAGTPYSGILLLLDLAMDSKRVADHAKSIKMFAESKESVAVKGDVLIVDEAQDCTRAQVIIILTALRSGASVLFVGDPSQGIMRFAGSESDPMGRMAGLAENSGVTTALYKLTTNFRSTSKIVKCSEAVLPPADRAVRGKIQTLAEGSEVRLLKSNSELRESKLVASDIKKALDNGVPAGKIAVTQYTNYAPGCFLATEFRKLNIPFVILGTPHDTTSPPARLVSFLRVCIGLDEFEQEASEQATLLQNAARSLKDGTMSDGIREAVIAVCSERRCSVVDAFLDTTAMEATLLKECPHTFIAGKRTLTGEQVPKPHKKLQNMTGGIAAFKKALTDANKWIDAAFKGHKLPDTLPRLPSTVPRCSSILADAVLAIYVKHLKVDFDRCEELTHLIRALDALGSQCSFSDLSEVVDNEWAILTSKKADDVVVLSTFHKFKGKERSRVYCVVCTLKLLDSHTRLTATSPRQAPSFTKGSTTAPPARASCWLWTRLTTRRALCQGH